MTAFFDADKSLRTFPTTRAAYSDRTSWMMSEMSALAYLKFEGQDRFGEVFDLVRTLGKRVLEKETGKDLSAQIEALETRLQQYITDQIGPPPHHPRVVPRSTTLSVPPASFWSRPSTKAALRRFSQNGHPTRSPSSPSVALKPIAGRT